MTDVRSAPAAATASFRRMALSISVGPSSSIDLSLRHVSTTWPGHHGCDPDVRGRRGRGVHPSRRGRDPRSPRFTAANGGRRLCFSTSVSAGIPRRIQLPHFTVGAPLFTSLVDCHGAEPSGDAAAPSPSAGHPGRGGRRPGCIHRQGQAEQGGCSCAGRRVRMGLSCGASAGPNQDGEVTRDKASA